MTRSSARGARRSKRRAPTPVKSATTDARAQDGAARPQVSQVVATRNHTIDVLRGMAILLMVADHLAGIVLGLPLESAMRSVTRLAEPLFVVTFGYLLVGSDRRRAARRLPKIVGAALICNALFFPAYEVLEILATFAAVIVLYLGVGRHLVLFAPAVLLQPWDPTVGVLDYPLALVASQVALGMLLHHRLAPGFVAAYLILPLLLLPAEQSRTVPFTGAAVVLLHLATRRPGWRVPVLDWLGRNPLEAYVGQFLVIFALAWLAEAPASRRIEAWYGVSRSASEAPAHGRRQGAGIAVPTTRGASPCLGPALPLELINDLPAVEIEVAGATGVFVVDFATTASTLDPRQFPGMRPTPLPGTTDRWAEVIFFGRWPEARLLVRDYAAYRGVQRRAGIIGTDFLATATHTIDWRSRRLHRADPHTRCSAADLRALGLKPLSSAGYYGNEAAQLTRGKPNVPVVPVQIGTVQAPAQIDTGFDDRSVRHSLNVNQALFDELRASGPELVRSPELDVGISSCTGQRVILPAYRLPQGRAVELLGTDGEAVRRFPEAVLFLKGDAPETRACGGIGTWDEPAGQLGVSFFADAGLMVVDPFDARIWLPADPTDERQP